jgi:glycosyltransferase involved in cell wall biosynthesis
MPQAPRVAVVTSRFDVGGTERHLTRVIPELRRRGIDIVLYVMERGGPLESGLIAQGVPIEGAERGFLHWPRATLQLARFLRRERPDIVHFFLPRPYIYGSLAAELVGHRRRIMSRRSLANYMARYPAARTIERALHRRCLGLIGNSQAVVEQLTAECGDAQKVGLLYNGVDIPDPAMPAERGRTRQNLQISEQAITLAVVANLIPYKGHRDLIEALALIHEAMPRPWSLLVIGRDDGIGGELKDRAGALGLADNIIWLGEQAGVDEFLRASDIFVLPSREEGFSNALLEAMAAGVPVIATAVGGNRDAVTDGESGLLVRPGNPSALGGAILKLAADAALRARLGAAARQRVRDYFSLDACVSGYEALYREINEQRPKPIKDILAAVTISPSDRAKPPASIHPR